VLSGEAPVGGASSVGRGFLEGTAEIRRSDGKHYRIESDLKVEEKALKDFNEWIKAFHQPALKNREEEMGS